MRWKLGFVTKLLGMPASKLLGAPKLFFDSSIVNTIGPRLTFLKDCLPESTQRWAPSSLLRSDDRVRLTTSWLR